MNRTPMELAALASAAIPGLSPTGVAGSPDDPRDFDAAVVLDLEGSQWRVRSPRHQEAAMRLETELQVLSGFTPGIRAALPFRVPSVAGAVRLEGMRTFVYHDLPGRELDLTELIGLGSAIVSDVARVIVAIHSLPDEVVESADLPVYTADQFRTRRLNELDQAATTGRIPPVLLRRWENALEERQLWDFAPVVVHGDLHEDNLLVDRHRLVAVTGWTDLHIGDPADDFAWLASAGEPDFADAVLEAYAEHLGSAAPLASGGPDDGPVPGAEGPDSTRRADPHLLRRAALAAEFALAQWLVRGIAAEDEQTAAEAEEMLRELQQDVEERGGQQISLNAPGPLPQETPVARGSSVAMGIDHGGGAQPQDRPGSGFDDGQEGGENGRPDGTAQESAAQDSDNAGDGDAVPADDDTDGAVITDADAAEESTGTGPYTRSLELDHVRQLRRDP